MRTVIELSDADIIEIIANAFDVDKLMVTLSVKGEPMGPGPMESVFREVVSARVTLKGGAPDVHVQGKL